MSPESDIRKVPLEKLVTMPWGEFVKLIPKEMKERLGRDENFEPIASKRSFLTKLKRRRK